MALRLAERLRAPIFDDEERTRVAGLLHIVYILLIALLSTLLAARLLTTGPTRHWFMYPILILLAISLLAALRRGFIYSGGLIMIGTLIAYAAIGTLAAGGMRSSLLNILILALVFGAVLGRSRILIGLTVTSLLAVFAVAVLQSTIELPEPMPFNLAASTLATVAVVATSGLCLTLIILSLKQALRRTREQEHRAATMAEEAEHARKLTADVIASMAESVIILDSKATIVSTNVATTVLLGFSQEELVGAHIERVLVDGHHDMLRDGTSITSSIMTHRDRTYRMKSGEHIDVRFSRSILHDDNGKLRGIVCVATDIRRDKEIERNLRQAKELAEDASKAKSRFLANMSHELRTPLNAVIGYAELLMDEAEERGFAESVDDLGRIQSSAKHLLGLISDILDLSKVEAGKMELHLETFDVNDMLSSVLDSVRPMIRRKGLGIHVAIPEAIGFIHADQTKIRQVLINLLGNAVKFTESGEIRFAVRQGLRDGLRWIQFFVSDTGIGMTQSQISRLFEAFSQPNAAAARRHGGTGLGLALSRVFAEMMGGTITVRSALDRGSAFKVEIPYLDPTEITMSGLAHPEVVAKALGISDAESLLPYSHRRKNRESGLGQS